MRTFLRVLPTEYLRRLFKAERKAKNKKKMKQQLAKFKTGGLIS